MKKGAETGKENPEGWVTTPCSRCTSKEMLRKSGLVKKAGRERRPREMKRLQNVRIYWCCRSHLGENLEPGEGSRRIGQQEKLTTMPWGILRSEERSL